MLNNNDSNVTTEALIEGLKIPSAYPHPVSGHVEVYETHISIVFLAGEFAYKIKKPVITDFLDYSTLEKRRHFCLEEKRLDGRYSSDLYIGVVPIGWDKGRLRIEAESHAIEYAVKMRRFPNGALLSEKLKSGTMTTVQVHQLAETVAIFHQHAAVCEPKFASEWPDFFGSNFNQVILRLQSHVDRESATTLKVLQSWADDCISKHKQVFVDRVESGFVRECHGDLHLQNVVHWGERLVPFDGIEFNERLRWIDVLCDATFLEMDLAYRGHLDLARLFINTYVEQSGDYRSLVILRPFLIYRSLVRALVATMRSVQSDLTTAEREAATLDARKHISLAYRFTLKEAPRLWITHGVSGSGKSTLSEAVIERHDALRLRSDVERKRLFGLAPTERPSAETRKTLYSDQANERTYKQLQDLAQSVLRAGYSVIIDATFLRRADRELFHETAEQEGVPFAILDCHSDEQSLRQRVADRRAKNYDASDADLRVLEHQLAAHQPLTESERSHVVDIPDLVEVAEHL